MRGVLLITILFAIAAVVLAGARPLWLDEILQLIETRQPSTAQMMAELPRNAGAAPLGYLVQRGALSVTGYSLRRARLPAALCATAAVFTVGVLAAELGLRCAWIASAVFALFPMTLRYATESRVYSLALVLSVLATLIYLRVGKVLLPVAGRPTPDQPAKPPVPPSAAAAPAIVYGLALIAAIQTQAYSASVGVALVISSVVAHDWRAARRGAAAFVVAVILFLPWYLWSKARWAATLSGGSLHFSASWKTPLMLFRELAGAGYWGSAALLALCAMALARGGLDRRVRLLLVLLITVPLVLLISADAVLDYFIASRQFLWVLPAVAILAASEIEQRIRAAISLGVLLAVICVVQNIRFFTAPRENWDAAATAITEQTDRGACLTVAPPDLSSLYEFFRPQLRRARCQDSVMVLAVTPYTTRAQQESAAAMLTVQGYQQVRESNVGGSRIVTYHR